MKATIDSSALTEQEKLTLCLIAGCKVDMEWKEGMMTLRTANPCAVVEINGRYQVVEYRGK